MWNAEGKPTSHLFGFLERASTMIAAEIDPVFVFDGRPHELKDHTLSERKERRVAAEEKYAIALEAEDWKKGRQVGCSNCILSPEMVAE